MTRIPLETPCVGICSTVYGDTICRGCKRHFRHIIDWNALSDIDKAAIMQQLDQQLLSAVKAHIKTIDVSLLKKKLTQFQVRVPTAASDFTLPYFLLRAGAEKINKLHNFGICAQQAEMSAQQLFQRIDEQFYQLAVSQQQQTAALLSALEYC